MSPSNPWPSMKSKKARAYLRALGYRETRRSGSHCILECEGRPRVVYARHDKVTLSPGEVRSLFLRDVKLSSDEISEVFGICV